MVADNRFDPYGDQLEEKAKRKSWWTTCLTGCLITAIIGIVIVVAVGIWVARNMRNWVSNLASEGMRQGIQASDLDPQEKQELLVQADRITQAYRDGRLSNEQAMKLGEKLVHSPVVTSLIVTGVERRYFARSGLSDEERAQGRITLQRYVHGMIDDKLDEKSMDAVMPHIADKDPDGGWRLHEHVNDEDLRAFLDAAKQQADQAGIPEKPEPYDPSDEIKKLVDEALNES